ncbi:DUF5696 domain-containing protein [Acholeplasma sp. OttesenSCG-928-E16]|nr:DUF5696 domain-containing protein [Acholeplasma sp. OttesenSCG-928-E16]
MKKVFDLILKHKVLSILIASIILLTGILLIYFLTGSLKSTRFSTPGSDEFSLDGFIDSETLSNTDKLVASNDSYELHLDETKSYFYIKDKKTGYELHSNTTEKDVILNENQTAQQEKQFSTLEITYHDKKGATATINNYALSINHPPSLDNLDATVGKRTFSIKYIDNGFQVLYDIANSDIDYLYFPKYIGQDFYLSMTPAQQNMINRKYTFRGTIDEFYYEMENYERMTNQVKADIYPIFYGEGGLGYTRDRAIAENEEWGYTETFLKVQFQVAIQITLNKSGFEAKVIKESIKEESNAKVAKISLLPMLGLGYSDVSAGVDTSGYLVVPDGSGAVIQFNNGRRTVYEKRVYGQDLALMPIKMAESQQKISIPVFGMSKENIGFGAIITEGDAMSLINAEISDKTETYSSSYNKVYASFNLRETEAVKLGGGWNQYGIQLWTKDIVDTDFAVQYNILTGEDNNYVGMAKAYQNYLVEQFNFVKNLKSSGTILTTEFVGAYDAKKHFVGIPYTSVSSLTSYNQAIQILKELDELGVSNINANYLGAINGGLTSSISNKTNIENSIGGNSGYKKYQKYTSENNIDEYTTIDFLTASKYGRLFDQYRYSSKRIQGSLSYDYQYHLPSGLPYSETSFNGPSDLNVVNPVFYKDLYKHLSKKNVLDGFTFNDLGARLAGSYDSSSVVYKQYAMDIQRDLLAQIEQKMMLSNPLGFAFSYADYIVDLPSQATLYSMIDYSIPLVQLVLSGFIDYSNDSINTSEERSKEYLFLKSIEMGANLKYTLSYDNSQELINTHHNYYMSTYYVNWLDDIKNNMAELNALKIHEGYLVGHEQVAIDVYKVTYSNGIEIVINYNIYNFNYGGNTINSMDYLVVKGG